MIDPPMGHREERSGGCNEHSWIARSTVTRRRSTPSLAPSATDAWRSRAGSCATPTRPRTRSRPRSSRPGANSGRCAIPSASKPWLHRILTNECYAEARRRRRWSAEIRVLPVAGTSEPGGILTIDDRDQLERAFRRLTLEQRAILVFHHYLGLPLPEVADRLDIPIGTAKSRLHYATAALRASLEADARTPSFSEERPA